jgi:hypothetical protein
MRNKANANVLKTRNFSEQADNPGRTSTKSHDADFFAPSLDLQVLDCAVNEFQFLLFRLWSYNGV